MLEMIGHHSRGNAQYIEVLQWCLYGATQSSAKVWCIPMYTCCMSVDTVL